MARITPVSPGNAQENVKEGYEIFIAHFGTISKLIQMLSVRSDLFDIQLMRSSYFASKSNLSFSLSVDPRNRTVVLG